MIKFSIGLSLFMISMIIGLSQYFENVDRHQKAEARYKSIQQQVKRQGQFAQRLERAQKRTLNIGEDQKARIQQALELTRTGLEFQFTSNVRPEKAENRGFYRHDFEITGQTSYFDLVTLLGKLAAKPGFIINSVCVRCGFSVATEDNKQAIRIRGFIHVSNPATL